MFRQTGDELVFGEDGLLRRGLIIRLLVLPNDIGGVKESLEWIRDELSPRVAISMMAQYYPTHQAATSKRHVLLSRRITETEWLRAVSALDELGMEEGWMQEFDGAAYYYRPNFENRETPFKDIRDFICSFKEIDYPITLILTPIHASGGSAGDTASSAASIALGIVWLELVSRVFGHGWMPSNSIPASRSFVV